ncbi:MAG: hypothetical protein H7Y43_13210 [Akkermansiaceae bacterium]|nr:hypothetical protein [Verrucomicrobiales bacterium]
MKNLLNPKRIIAASLACLTLLSFVSSATAALTVTTANQIGTANTYPFTPTWGVDTNTSLIAGLVPSAVAGNFSLEVAGRDVNTLTVNTNLTIAILQPSTSCSSNYVTCGNGGGAGSLIVYTLPASANGYNLTNITVFGGWANNGRDAQAFTVLYSTVANPANFLHLTTVNYNPSIPGNTASATREIINDSLGGLIAANVAAVKFVFNFPSVENGYVGYSAITVGGTAAGSVVSPVVAITTSNQNNPGAFTPTWTPETPNLIAGLAPSTASGNFMLEASGGTSILTDGVLGTSGDVAGFATCGARNDSGNSLIYTLTNVVNGSDVTNIVLYSGWGNNARDGQYYTLSYSTISAPTAFIPITTVFYDPQGVSGASANRVAIAMNNGAPLGSHVANLKFDFSTPPSADDFDNAYQGYSEIIVQGKDTATPPPPPSPTLVQDTLPSYAETVVGDQVVFRAIYSNSPPASLQWQQVVSSPATNNINAGVVNVTNNGVITSTLTLNNVQLASSGSYRLKADNATNGAAAPSYSASAPLVVGNVPAAVNNVILKYAGQSGLGPIGIVNLSTNFHPTWTINTNNDLILGFPTDGSGNPGTATAGPGNYGLGSTAGDPTVLADGTFGFLNYWPDVGGSPSLVSCGAGLQNPGTAMTYTLDTSAAPNGFDLTNITVYGGWADSGRNEQKYEVKYSTIAAPTSFNSLGVFNYNPNNPNARQSATRVMLVPATGALAQNVAAVQINWSLQGSPPKNDWEGYSEIIINGTASAPIPVLTQDITPLTADDVVGSTLTLMAGFTGATSYQWQKNGTNLPGATSPTLTLSPLQLSHTATNGGYRLTASNPSGTAVTRGCAVIIHPAPAAVGNVATAFAHQTSDAGSFTPTWDTSLFGSSLISFTSPSSTGTGNFNDPDGNPISFNQAGGLPVLTDGDYGANIDGGPHPAFATCGNNAGRFVIYTLPATANGYDLTNILVASGWNDGNRDANWGTVSYSTVVNPANFIPLAVLTNNPSGSIKSVIRATITPGTGVLASNVFALKVDFTTPPGIENGYSGFSQINVFGSPSANPSTGPLVTVENQTDVFTWTVETPNLIANQLPSSSGPGVFTLEGCNVTNLTDGAIGFGFAFGASCGADGFAVPWIVFNSATGWDLTNIVVYTLWHDYGREGQFYNVSYSTLAAPATFLPLTTVIYNPDVPQDGRDSGNRVNISPALSQTTLATNVAAVKFDFTPQGSQDFGWSGYSEIVLQGSNLAQKTPPLISPPTVSGGNLIFRGTGGTPNQAYSLVTSTNLLTPIAQWTVSTTGVLNGSGAFSNAVPIDPAMPTRFFRVRLP